jgi:hypothetical protein
MTLYVLIILLFTDLLFENDKHINSHHVFKRFMRVYIVAQGRGERVGVHVREGTTN